MELMTIGILFSILYWKNRTPFLSCWTKIWLPRSWESAFLHFREYNFRQKKHRKKLLLTLVWPWTLQRETITLRRKENTLWHLKSCSMAREQIHGKISHFSTHNLWRFGLRSSLQWKLWKFPKALLLSGENIDEAYVWDPLAPTNMKICWIYQSWVTELSNSGDSTDSSILPNSMLWNKFLNGAGPLEAIGIIEGAWGNQPHSQLITIHKVMPQLRINKWLLIPSEK